ncbi:MAG: hypothetical protein WCS31_16835 [Verrucomicrobiae bacterium]
MMHRTSFALDEPTARRLRGLSSRWNVSQAEVVRRSVERAELADKKENADPASKLRALFAAGRGLDARKASAYIAEVYEDRKQWRGR